MSEPVAGRGDVRLSTIIGVALTGLAALAAALLWMSRPAQTVERTANNFLHAVIDGNRAEARRYLCDELLRADVARSDAAPWKMQAEIRLTIGHAVVNGRQATVAAVLERGGYKVQPKLALEQLETGAWKIVGISGLAEDPSWLRDREILRNEALADDLAKALDAPLED